MNTYLSKLISILFVIILLIVLPDTIYADKLKDKGYVILDPCGHETKIYGYGYYDIFIYFDLNCAGPFQALEMNMVYTKDTLGNPAGEMLIFKTDAHTLAQGLIKKGYRTTTTHRKTKIEIEFGDAIFAPSRSGPIIRMIKLYYWVREMDEES